MAIAAAQDIIDVDLLNHEPQQTYTPTWTVVSGTDPTLGNGTITGTYYQLGKCIVGEIVVTLGSTTNPGSGVYEFSVPSTIKSAWAGRRCCRTPAPTTAAGGCFLVAPAQRFA